MIARLRRPCSYLAIANFHTVGHCPDYPLDPIEQEDGDGSNAPIAQSGRIPERRDALSTKKRKLDGNDRPAPIAPATKSNQSPPQLESPTVESLDTKPANIDSDKENCTSKYRFGDNDSSDVIISSSKGRKIDRPRGMDGISIVSRQEVKGNIMTSGQASSLPPSKNPSPADRSVNAKQVSPPTRHTLPHVLPHQQFQATAASSPLKRIMRPLHLLSLAQLSTVPQRQNFLCDVLAVIDWVSPDVVDVRAYLLGPKREIRLVDPTTDKRVLLSVFVDAHQFGPKPGTVAVFRNLRNHRWEGYSLNAFLNDCRGFRWFFPNSTTALLGISSLATRVGELTNWWHDRQQQQPDQSTVLAVEDKTSDQSQEEGKKEEGKKEACQTVRTIVDTTTTITPTAAATARC